MIFSNIVLVDSVGGMYNQVKVLQEVEEYYQFHEEKRRGQKAKRQRQTATIYRPNRI